MITHILTADIRSHIHDLEVKKMGILSSLEATWHLKSRAIRIKEGDINTKLFHMLIIDAISIPSCKFIMWMRHVYGHKRTLVKLLWSTFKVLMNERGRLMEMLLDGLLTCILPCSMLKITNAFTRVSQKMSYWRS